MKLIFQNDKVFVFFNSVTVDIYINNIYCTIQAKSSKIKKQAKICFKNVLRKNFLLHISPYKLVNNYSRTFNNSGGGVLGSLTPGIVENL